MKRFFALLLALVLALALTPAVLADVIWIPGDPFLQQHMEDCTHHERGYYAAGPDGSVTAYSSPESSAVEKKLSNGEYVHIGWVYTDPEGIAWGFCEDWGDANRTDWTGWMPMDYLLLKYDSQAFQEEFAGRIRSQTGELTVQGEVRFWNYPGGEECTTMAVADGYLPAYMAVFTDDAGRDWGHVVYFTGVRDTWVCLDDPVADYDTLYKNAPPQAVTHPVQPDTLAEIKPGGIGAETVLLAAAAVAVISGAFLWLTRKKKA